MALRILGYNGKQMAEGGFSGYPPFGKDAVRINARVEVKGIADLCRFMGLYEGVAFVRTSDPERGIVEFWVSPSFLDDFREIFEALRREIPMEILEEEK